MSTAFAHAGRGHARRSDGDFNCRCIARLVMSGVLLLGLGCVGIVDVATAAPVPWNKQVVSYVSEKRPVKEVLRDVLATQSFPVVMTGDIRGEVTGRFNEPAQRIFNKLAAAYGLVWFFNGSVLYVSPNTDLRSEVVELGLVDPARVPVILNGLGLLEERFPVRVSRGGALVSGPSRYVELVVKALRAEAQGAQGAQNSQQSKVQERAETIGVARIRVPAAPTNRRVRVYQLTYAQAADVIHEVNGQRQVTPGMVSLLRGLAQSATAPKIDEQQDALDDVALDAPFVEGVPDVRSRQRRRDSARGGVELRDADAVIEADVRTNSVIIHASKEVLDSYGDVIRRLDLPRQLVQIDVTILSVASSAMRDIGVALQAGDGARRASKRPSEVGEPPSGLIFNGVLGSSANAISVRVAALERKGRLKVVSRPRLVGLENLEAVLGSRTTAHVRVAGAYQTDLYPVSAGLELKVVPRVVSKPGDPVMFLLALNIAGGQMQQSVQVDGMPVASEVALSTQAIVGDGQTLLIGGHQQENFGREHSGVPGLSRVPVVGGLFRRRRNSDERSEQVLLITPRLVASNVSSMQAVQGGASSPSGIGCSTAIGPDARGCTTLDRPSTGATAPSRSR